MSSHGHSLPSVSEFRELFFQLLGPEQRFYKLVLIYSVAISLLTLAIPISVQALIDTIANIGLVRAIVVISLFLFGLLIFSGALYALRAYIMELFNRRLFIRISSEMALSAVAARESGTDERKRLALFNRFFDIMTLKKNVPHILTNGFSLVLQSIIGFLVVSLYHLYFFLFAMVLVLLIWLVWRLWGWKAIHTAFLLSEAKYETADWLQTLSINLRDFKATGNVEYILEEFNDVVNHHVDEQEKHFAYNYRQLLSFLLINALASAVLLGMGGWLVIQGELTLGQLVAAELIMLGIFAGLPMMAGYLEYFYDICAAVEEISRFKQLPKETVTIDNDNKLEDPHQVIRFKQAGFGDKGSAEELVLNLTIQPGEILRASSELQRCRDLFKSCLTANIYPGRGEVYFGKLSMQELNAFELRKQIKVIDRASVIPGSISHYMKFSNPHAKQAEIRQALELAGMDLVIDHLPAGLDTIISADAWPLSLEHCLRLKLAAAILSRPGVLVLDQIVDLVDGKILQHLLTQLKSENTTVIYFTRREDISVFTRELNLDTGDQE